MFNIIIFGAPGSGKGTQSKRLAEKYHLTHISTGEVLRNEIAQQTELGKIADGYMSKGNLVPDEVVIDILAQFFVDTPNVEGYIFDGFPRTLHQGEAMDRMLEEKGESINVVLCLEVDEEELVQRLLKRGEEEGRKDDTLETIKSRLKVYTEKTAPLKEFYSKQGKLVKIEGVGTVDEIFGRIEQVVKELKS